MFLPRFELPGNLVICQSLTTTNACHGTPLGDKPSLKMFVANMHRARARYNKVGINFDLG